VDDHGAAGAGEAQSARESLEQALARGPLTELPDWLQEVAEAIPLAIGADFDNIRVQSTTNLLHLVGASGCSVIEIRKRAFTPLEVGSVERMIESGGHDELARSLGIPWMYVAWMVKDGQSLGTIATGCRSKRRPTEEGLDYVEDVAIRIADYIVSADRSDDTLAACSMRLAQLYAPPVVWPSDVEPIASLRPRERSILELYADGLTTEEIAELLVLSRHTIRSHVRNALHTLGVHTREEAATMVRADQLAQLL